MTGGLFLVLLLTATGLPGTSAQDTSPEPYYTHHRFDGQIGCAWAAFPFQTGDYCAEDFTGHGFQADPNARSTFDVPIDAGVTGMVLVLTSDGGAPIEPAFEVGFLVPVGGIPDTHGHAPLYAVHTFEGEAWTAHPQDGEFSVRADPHQTLPQVAYQEPFVVCLTFLYHGAAPPDIAC